MMNDGFVKALLSTGSLFIALLVGSLSYAPPAQAGRIVHKQIEVKNEEIKGELNKLLKEVSDLHTACYEREEDKISTALKSVIQQIDTVRSKVSLAGNSSAHILKILNASKEQLELASLSEKDSQQKKHLKEAFKQLTLVPQTFDLDPYRIFFCPKDEATWFQKSWKAKNPINPWMSSKSCKFVRQ